VQKGEKLTQTAIAAVTRLSRQTVAKYSEIINEVKANPSGSVVEIVSGSSKNVNYGTHQIPAPCGEPVDFENEEMVSSSVAVTRKSIGQQLSVSSDSSTDHFGMATLQLLSIPPPD
jgi:hypothetical protein